jgi:hypothetical protein
MVTSERRVPVVTDVVIYKVLPTGVAFAERYDNGENVYINHSVASISGVREGDVRQAKLVTNNGPSTTPWFATYVAKAVETAVEPELELDLQSEQEPEPEMNHEALAMKLIDEMTLVSTQEVREELGINPVEASNLLMRMHRNGLLQRVEVYKAHDQSRASRRLWTKDIDQVL